ncbi:hypothetical protein [Mycobacterium sp. E740]|uniref:hypothetical protein n=1 Tax=Mycobacterium sp. E740 TaxID=1834149 RepID=UPI0007FDDC15|nr:hypothetical protein [Mycobacterium sp. E740]OBI81671.1 hypothetical protein A5663_15700 [Mycobacterium sp. E740]
MQTGTGDSSDPATERVRRELARLGHDEASAPDVPAEVTARVGAALQAAEPAHAIGRPRLRRSRVVGLAAGLAAAVAAVLVGTTMATRESAPRFAQAGPTAQRITVSRTPAFPLTGPQLVAVLGAPPDYGPLSDAALRAGCLQALGYPTTTPILGARTIDMQGRPAVLLLLPSGSAGQVTALVVEAGCHTAHGGLLAETAVERP